jgi:hypothetical protein
MTAWSKGVRPPAQAEIVPSSVSKMKTAGMPVGFAVETVPGTTNAGDGFQMMPVGAVGVGFGGGAWGRAGGSTPRAFVPSRRYRRKASNNQWRCRRSKKDYPQA